MSRDHQMDHLLLVDDDVELCEILKEYFTGEGFDLEAAHDGLRGLERARSGEHGLMILDLLLPGMRGLEVLRQLRSDSNLPMLILTARGADVDRIVGWSSATPPGRHANTFARAANRTGGGLDVAPSLKCPGSGVIAGPFLRRNAKSRAMRCQSSPVVGSE